MHERAGGFRIEGRDRGVGEVKFRLHECGVGDFGDAIGGDAGADVFLIAIDGGDDTAFGNLHFIGSGCVALYRDDGEFENAGGVSGFGGFEFPFAAGLGLEGELDFIRLDGDVHVRIVDGETEWLVIRKT